MSLPGSRNDGGDEFLPIPTGSRSPVARNDFDQVVPYDYVAQATEEPKVDIREYLRVIIKNRVMIFSSIVVFAVLGLSYSLLATRIYTAISTIQIDAKTMKIVESDDVVQNSTQDKEFILTQFQLLSSRRLAERVVTELALTKDDDFMGRKKISLVSSTLSLFRPAPKQTTVAESAEIESAAATIMGNTAIVPYPQTSVTRIRITDQSPVRARNIANAMADGFVALNLDRRLEATAYARKFLEDQLSQLKLKLETSERELIAFAQKEQIISIDDEKRSINESALSNATKDLSDATADRIKQEEIWRTAERATGGSLNAVLENKVVQGLSEKRANLVSEYQLKLGSFKPDFPVMIQIRGQIAELDRQLGAETASIKKALQASYEAAVNREQSLVQNVDRLKATLLDEQKRGVEYQILKRETDTSRQLYNDLLNRYKEVGVVGNTGVNNISIVDRALLPSSPTSPRMGLNIALGLLIGACIGIGAAFLRERIDDRMNSPEEVQRTSKLVSIGMIPRFQSSIDRVNALADPHSSASEAYRSLATALQFSTSAGLPKTVLVTSCGPGEGKSTTSMTVARHYANVGLQVLLMDCDLRRPSLHRALGLSNEIGVSSYLAGRCAAPDTLQITDHPNLVFMSSGPLPPNPAELLSGPKFASLLSTASQKFDVVIIDAAPVMGLADSPIIANKAAATMIVVAAGQASRMGLQKTLERLRFARGHVIGTVMTKFDAKSAGYGYGYGYGYGHGGGDHYGYGREKQDSLPKAS